MFNTSAGFFRILTTQATAIPPEVQSISTACLCRIHNKKTEILSKVMIIMPPLVRPVKNPIPLTQEDRESLKTLESLDKIVKFLEQRVSYNATPSMHNFYPPIENNQAIQYLTKIIGLIPDSGLPKISADVFSEIEKNIFGILNSGEIRRSGSFIL